MSENIIIWKKSVMRKDKVLRTDTITLFYDKLIEKDMSYVLYIDNTLSAILYRGYNKIEGEWDER